ncbi:MAG: UbiD family decarboxylase, partial [SAR202 cluster bacterium]|nr:UbiD family decarboxylase [SAR202 cluster bacterium]
MPYLDLQSFITDLERHGQLRRIAAPVDPQLEITEVYSRVVRERGPALLFENVQGSSFPLVINLFGSERRVRLALGIEPGALGESIVKAVQDLMPPSPGALWRNRTTLLRLRSARTTRVRNPVSQQVVDRPGDLTTLPALKCWPRDGGRFLTWPLVLTRSPRTGRSNLGVYRMQVYSPTEAGLHWQVAKGGGFHYTEAEERNEPLEVAVVLGGDPALMLASVLPLPETLEELLFAGLLRGKPTPMTFGKTMRGLVPANAEFVLEGVARPLDRRLEGPFGDHLGHYSEAAPFPVLHLRAVTRRRSPVFPAAIVGAPPQEERLWGETSQALLKPFLRLLRPEITDLWAYYEGGFVNLLVASTKARFGKEPLRTALWLLGEGQLSLAKWVVMVDPDVDVQDFRAVLRAMRANFRPESDFWLVSGAALDSLDFTSYRMHLGSRMVMDATTKPGPDEPLEATLPPVVPDADQDVGRAVRQSPLQVDPKALCPEITRWRLVEDAMLAVQMDFPARGVLERLVASGGLQGVKVVAAVSMDVDLED